MKNNYTYRKETSNGTEWYRGMITRENRNIYNPPEQLILESGWNKHLIEPPELYYGEDNNSQAVILERLFSNFPKLEGLICPVVDGIVYHYTTWEVLFKGILNESNLDARGNRCLVLRAYSVNYMNDSSEGLLLPIGIADHEREFIHSFGKEISQFRYNIWQRGAEQRKQKRFSISFSHENDSLPMWNYYGFNGKGICLGFDVKAICDQGHEIYDCIYDVSNIYKLANVAYENRAKYPGFLSLLAKDIHFEYERECRISIDSIYPGNYIKTDRDIFYPIKYDLKGGYIVPYVDIFLPLSSIKEIVIGPTNNIVRAEDSLRGWLSSIDLRNIRIKTSNAPLAI